MNSQSHISSQPLKHIRHACFSQQNNLERKNRRQRVHSLFLILNPLLRKCRSSRIFSTVSRYSSIVVEKQLTTISPPRFSIMNIARPFIPRSVISMTIIEIFFCGDGRLEFEKATRVPLWDVVLDPMARATVRIGIRNQASPSAQGSLGETLPVERIRKNGEWDPVVGAHTWTSPPSSTNVSSSRQHEYPENSGEKMWTRLALLRNFVAMLGRMQDSV